MDGGQYGEGGQPPGIASNSSQDSTMEDSSNTYNNSLTSSSSQYEINSYSNRGNVEIVNNVGNLGEASNNQNVKTVDINSLSQGAQGKNNGRKINVDRRYTVRDTGPFHVFIEHTELNLGSLHPMKVGRILDELAPELQAKITEVKTVGRNRVKIEVETAAVANLLVVHEVFRKNKLIAYVPQHLTEKKAIIRNVDTSLSEDEVVRKIKSVIPVLEAKRFTRVAIDRDTGKVVIGSDGKPKRIPRQMILLTFQGRTVPEFIYIDRVRCPTEKYVPPVIQCFSCFLYGHTKTQCKSREKCRKCARTHEGPCPETAPFCIHCKSTDHGSISKMCPSYNRQKKIKTVMSDYTLTFKEAEKIVALPSFANILTRNRFSALQSNSEEFPPLQTPRQNPIARRIANSQPNPLQTTGTARAPSKRQRVQTPPPCITSDSSPSFHFCGPPIQNNPHATISQNVSSQLTNALVEFIGNLVTNLIPGNSDIFNKQEIESQIQTLIINSTKNKPKQNSTCNASNSVEC